MKKIGAYFVAGLGIAFLGILLSDVFNDIFNGMPNGTGAVIGMGAYLCVVIVTCTGILVAKSEHKSDDGEPKR